MTDLAVYKDKTTSEKSDRSGGVSQRCILVIDEFVERSSTGFHGGNMLPQVLEVVQQHYACCLVHQALWDPPLHTKKKYLSKNNNKKPKRCS